MFRCSETSLHLRGLGRNRKVEKHLWLALVSRLPHYKKTILKQPAIVLGIALVVAFASVSSQSFWIDESGSAILAIAPDPLAFTQDRGSTLQMPEHTLSLWAWKKPSDFFLADVALAVLLKKSRWTHHLILIRFRERRGGEPSVKLGKFSEKAVVFLNQLKRIS
jgi:hypothetical protein